MGNQGPSDPSQESLLGTQLQGTRLTLALAYLLDSTPGAGGRGGAATGVLGGTERLGERAQN